MIFHIDDLKINLIQYLVNLVAACIWTRRYRSDFWEVSLTKVLSIMNFNEWLFWPDIRISFSGPFLYMNGKEEKGTESLYRLFYDDVIKFQIFF